MASTLYVADDGTIHSRPVTTGTGVGRTPTGGTRVSSPAPAATMRTNTATYTPTRHYVSEGRKVGFWIATMIISLLIGLGAYQLLGAEIFGVAEEGADAWTSFFAAVGPFIMVIGAVGGSILYGIFFAEDADYNLGTYFLSALAAVGGMIALGIAVAIIAVIVVIVLYLLAIAFVIGIICAILSGGS